MQFRRLNRDALAREYGVESQRLLPWPALNAPFEGAFAVVRPGGASVPHAHDEYEMFIALAGEAVIDSDGRRAPFAAGDVVHFEPGVSHQVLNEGTEDFEMFSVWWDAAMTQAFEQRHRGERGT